MCASPGQSQGICHSRHTSVALEVTYKSDIKDDEVVADDSVADVRVGDARAPVQGDDDDKPATDDAPYAAARMALGDVANLSNKPISFSPKYLKGIISIQLSVEETCGEEASRQRDRPYRGNNPFLVHGNKFSRKTLWTQCLDDARQLSRPKATKRNTEQYELSLVTLRTEKLIRDIIVQN